MNQDKIMAVIGLIGLLLGIFGGLVLFDPKTLFGTMFGLIGFILAMVPYIHLYFREETSPTEVPRK